MNQSFIRDMGTLLAAIEQGYQPEYLYFWSSFNNVDGSISETCLSQWFAAGFDIDGIHYRTAEHYMMAQKAKFFGDMAVFEQIIHSSHPKLAKKLGRKVANFDEKMWNEHRFDIVVKGNLAKFSQHDELKAFLLATGNRVLVEASPVDKIWGVGLAKDDENIANPLNWNGLNLLGFALMVIRDSLNG